jgi:hypothetical protein
VCRACGARPIGGSAGELEAVDVEIDLWLGARHICVLLKVGYAFFGEDVLAEVPAEQVPDDSGRDYRPGPQREMLRCSGGASPSTGHAAKRQPMGEILDPADVARTVCSTLSDGSRGMTGRPDHRRRRCHDGFGLRTGEEGAAVA